MSQPEPTRTQLNQSTIQSLRLKKEIELIKERHEFELKDLPDNSKVITFYMDINKLDSIPLIIHIPKEYPFSEPKYTFEPPQGYLSKDSYGIKKPISTLLGEWNPGMKLSNIADEAVKQIQKSLVDKTIVKIDQMYDSLGEFKNLALLVAFSIFVRVLVGLGGYSGEGNPPEYGDFEAQRNWMSIAWNRPLRMWYNQPNQKPWWRLDYPPLAGYLSYVCALFMRIIHPRGLQQQQGYEELTFKSFMRMTIVFTDVISFFLPVLIYHYLWKVNLNVSRLQAVLLLLLPPFILIDHGHFQYNCVMLGLVLAAYVALINDQRELTCLLFTLALSTKQMALYYALGFFAILLGKALVRSKILNDINFRIRITTLNVFDFMVQVGKYAIIVFVITAVLWSPWFSVQAPELILQPLKAIFPVHRGLYQLKVPNFWCVTDVFFKWQSRFSSNTLVILCGLFSLAASLPSVICGILFPNKLKLNVLVFLNISLAFFFFSYHVHQKTILVPLLFVGLSLHMFGKLGLDFVVVSSFVMYHLLREDGLTLQYFVCNLAFLYFANPAVNTLHEMAPITYQKSQFSDQKDPSSSLGNTIIEYFDNAYNLALRKLLYILIVTLHLLDALVAPPDKLPYLFHLLFSTLGFIFFLVLWIVSNIRLVTDTLHLLASSTKKKID